MKQIDQYQARRLWDRSAKYAFTIVTAGVCIFLVRNAYLFASDAGETKQTQNQQDDAKPKSQNKDGKHTSEKPETKDSTATTPPVANDAKPKEKVVVTKDGITTPTLNSSPIVLRHMNLTAVIAGENSLALIDGQCVRVGDNIADYRVSKIDSNKVLLEKKRVIYMLELNCNSPIKADNESPNKLNENVPDSKLIERMDRDEWAIRLENIKKKIGKHQELILSKIDGTFNGWDETTVFELVNEQLWQVQNPSCYARNPLYMPPVAVYNTQDGYMMCIDQVQKEIPVRQLGVNYIGSIDGAFEGWNGLTIFRLMNGEYWQQLSDDVLAANQTSPKVYIYIDSNGQYCLKVRRIDDCIKIRRLANVIEGRITNYMRNLNDEIIIELNDNQQWIQLDEGFIDICTHFPKVLVYKNQMGEYVMHLDASDITLPVRRKN